MPATIQTTSKPLHPRALDTSGNNNHGTAYTGQALEFDGVGDYISADVLDIDIATENWTIACWINITAYASNSSYINVWGNAKDSSNRIGIQAYDQDSDSPKLAFATYNGSSYVSTASDVELDKDTWYYIVATCASNTLKLYINGTLQSGSAVAVSLSNTVKCVVGGLASGGNVFNGKISNFQAWNALWSASDVSYAYLNPEKLVLDNPLKSIPMLTYSDLKLWYPMQDGYRGQQSFLTDGANTGLGDEIITSDMSWNLTSTGANWSQDGTAFTSDGSATGRIYTAGAGSIVVGKTYKILYDITAYTSGAVRVELGTSGDAGAESNSGIGSYSTYFTAKTNTNIYINQGGLAFVGTFDNLSILPINDKNHGTSTFHGDEILSNTGFETLKSGESGNTVGTVTDLFDNWTVALGGSSTVEADTDVSPQAGTYACKMTYDGGQSYVYQDATVVSGRNYTLTFYVRGDGSKSGHIRVHKTTGGDYIAEADIGQTAASWAQKTYTFTADANGDVRIRLLTDTAASSVWFDEVSFKETGFATGWTDADAQPTIPQLGFQSYNQLGMLNGIDSKVVVSNNSALDVGTGDFSISLWVNATSDSGVQKIFDRNHATGYTMYISSGNLKVGLHGSLTTISNNIADSKWHHLVSSYDRSGNLNVYKNSVLIATIDISSDTEDLDNSNSLAFGQSSAGTAYPFEGTLTEISLWKAEALTAAKVQELYNDGEALDALTHSSVANLSGYWRNRGAGTWTDLSTNSNNGTATSVTEQLILPKGQNGRDTQGFLMNRTSTSGVQHTGAIAGSYTRFGHGTQLLSTPVSNASVECWFRSFGGTGASEGYATFFGSRASNNILLCRNGTAGTVSGLYYLTSGGNQNNLDSTTDCFDDEWHHIAFTFDSGVGKLYIDGSLEDTQDDTGDTIRMSSDTYYMETGADSVQGSRSFSGDVDDIAVYSTTLTVNQIARNYKAGKRRHKN